MAYIITGLGNPGEAYEGTRHNTGRSLLEVFRKSEGFPGWRHDKKLNALLSDGTTGGEQVRLLLPETFMNASGKAVAPLVKNPKGAARLIVAYDDLDLPLGTVKISWDRGSGGHKGLDSIMRSIKTRAFVRLRVGISPVTPGGKIRKPHGERQVSAFILKKFTPSEQKIIARVSKKAAEALRLIIAEGHERAMNEFN